MPPRMWVHFEILGGGVPPSRPNPHLVLLDKVRHFKIPFSDLDSEIHTRFPFAFVKW